MLSRVYTVANHGTKGGSSQQALPLIGWGRQRGREDGQLCWESYSSMAGRQDGQVKRVNTVVRSHIFTLLMLQQAAERLFV